jgi:hypothetical protein
MGQYRDEKRNLRFPCIQWKRERNFVYCIFKFRFSSLGQYLQKKMQHPIEKYFDTQSLGHSTYGAKQL